MTEQTGIPGYPAPKPEDLPEDERWQLEGGSPHTDDEKAMIYGDIPQQKAEEFDESNTDLSQLGSKNYRYFSQFDTYNIEMTDGSMVRYKHQSVNEMQYEELEELRAQISARMDMDEKPLNPIRMYHLERLWLDKLGEYYLLNTKTNKPMTQSERLGCKHQWVIHGVLKSCLLRSNNDVGPRGKN